MITDSEQIILDRLHQHFGALKVAQDSLVELADNPAIPTQQRNQIGAAAKWLAELEQELKVTEGAILDYFTAE